MTMFPVTLLMHTVFNYNIGNDSVNCLLPITVHFMMWATENDVEETNGGAYQSDCTENEGCH